MGQQRCPSNIFFLAESRVQTWGTQEILHSRWFLVEQQRLSSREGGGGASSNSRDLLLRPAGDDHQVALMQLPRLSRLGIISFSSLLNLPLNLLRGRVYDRSVSEQSSESELMSDPSSCDELWLLPQQVLAMDVDLLQAELPLSRSSSEDLRPEDLRFARASPSKSTFWMYSVVQGRLRSC